MQYKCVRGVVTSNGPKAVGDVFSLPDYEAQVLMGQGKIAPHHVEEIRTTAVDAVVTQSPAKGRKLANGR
jgi:hypothetical protein